MKRISNERILQTEKLIQGLCTMADIPLCSIDLSSDMIKVQVRDQDSGMFLAQVLSDADMAALYKYDNDTHQHLVEISLVSRRH